MKKQWRLRKRDYAGTHARRKAFRKFLLEVDGGERIDIHELVFGELITNAVRHGDEPMSAQVVVEDGVLLIETENAGRCFELERRLKQEPKTTSGRGLRIVRALADDLTVRFNGSRCRVTASVRI